MEEAQRLCHRVAILDPGRIGALDTPEALVRRLGGGLILLGLDHSSPGSGHNGHIQMVQDQAAQLPSVKAITASNSHLKIEAHRAQEALMGVLDITNRLDVRITSLEVLEPNLETVFLHLTGKRLRD
jgi:ABC-2 type transport system ATP-binding protein